MTMGLIDLTITFLYAIAIAIIAMIIILVVLKEYARMTNNKKVKKS